jgi:hypothetical protein
MAEGASARPSTWAQLTEEDYPELPVAKKTASAPRQTQQPTARDIQKQQQLKDINDKLQQLSSMTPAASNSRDSQRTLGAKNKHMSSNNSRGSSKNHSRRASRERADDNHRSNSNQGNNGPTLPPPFRSYFKGLAYNSNEGTGAVPILLYYVYP